MAKLKPGTRTKSAVCATELMVIQAPDGDFDVRCGGAPMPRITKLVGVPSVVSD